MVHERIAVDPHVMAGQPCIKGKRMPVAQILRELAAGMTINDIIDAHPHLTPEDVYAAIAYAADVVANEDVIVGSEAA
ncbi:MAG: DUF433 domain-containing protein [Anaerolineae bacterium]